jgi:23S rRNA pseudouridine2605 synthase
MTDQPRRPRPGGPRGRATLGPMQRLPESALDDAPTRQGHRSHSRGEPASAPPAETGDQVRLQKALAEAGMGSRREIEGWIGAGRVQVNGQVATLGQKVGPADRIRVDGQDVRRRTTKAPQLQVIAYNKPEGEIVTRKDPEERPTIFRRLPRPKSGRWISVGRLDINTSGLILVTNDGELANRLMHPSREVEREYAVRILGTVPDATLEQLIEGVDLDDGPARFDSIVAAGGEGANHWYTVTLREGRNREVRRLWEAVGCRVSRLVRTRYGSVSLGPRLFTGNWRPLTDDEIDSLLSLAGMERPREPRPRRPRGARPR